MKNLKKIGILVLILAIFGVYAWYKIAGKQQLFFYNFTGSPSFNITSSFTYFDGHFINISLA